MDQQTLSALTTYLLAHKWVAASAIAVFFIVRLFKSDVPLPLVAMVPPKLRTLLAVVLGFAGAGLQSVASGARWQQALIENMIGVLMAILTHDSLIEYVRNGRELFERKAKDAKDLTV